MRQTRIVVGPSHLRTIYIRCGHQRGPDKSYTCPGEIVLRPNQYNPVNLPDDCPECGEAWKSCDDVMSGTPAERVLDALLHMQQTSQSRARPPFTLEFAVDDD